MHCSEIFRNVSELLKGVINISGYKIKGDIKRIRQVINEASNALINHNLIPADEKDIAKILPCSSVA